MSRSSQLWAGLHCPALPLMAVWQLACVGGPLAVHDSVRGQTRILQVNALASQHGVKPGQNSVRRLALLLQADAPARSPWLESRTPNMACCCWRSTQPSFRWSP